MVSMVNRYSLKIGARRNQPNNSKLALYNLLLSL